MATFKEKVYPFYRNELNDRKYCVERILDVTIEKAKLSILLPRFFDKSAEVVERLQGTKYEFYAKQLHNYIVSKKPVQMTNAQRYRDEDLMHLIDQFQKHYEMLNYFPDWLDEINAGQCASLAQIALLKETAKQRFQMEALPQMQDEMSLSLIFIENAKVRKGLQTMARLMYKNRNSLRWRIAARESVFLEMESEVSQQAQRHAEILEEERKKAAVRANPRQFVQRELVAEEDMQQAGIQYNKTCDLNLKNEYTARGERNKWQIQLQALIKKYDQTMSDKFKELLYLDDRFAELKAEHQQFLKVYNRAEKVYNDIIKAKELEEERKRWAKIKAFMENRAARIIQLWYRAHLRITKPELVPKEVKKKGKKGKKGK